MSAHLTNAPPRAGLGSQQLGLGLALLVAASAVPVFGAGIVELAEAWVQPQYTHGPVVVLIALWIGLRALRDEPEALRRQPTGAIWPGMGLVLAGLVAGVLGTLAHVGDVAAYGIILWIGGVVLLTLGWTRGRRLWLPVALLVLMLPLPQFLYLKLTTFLQMLASDLATGMIRAGGLAVYQDGNIIDLGVYRLQVAEACAGLQFLFPVVSFAVLFAAMSPDPVWRRVALVLFAVPLAVGMNVLRIAVTAFLVDLRGIETAEGFLHAFEGWIILLASIGMLLLFMLALRLIPMRDGPRGPLLDLDLSGTGAVLARAGRIRSAPRFVTLAGAGVVAAALVLGLSNRTPEPLARNTFLRFPEQIGDWPGVRGTLDPAVAAVLKADDYLNTTYFSPEDAIPVQLFATFYSDQTRGSAIHMPDICLPANGWEVTEFGTRELDMSGAGFGRFDAIRAVVTKGTDHQLVYYWFEQRGTRMVNDFAVKLGVLADGLRRGRDDGALVRFVTPIGDRGEIPAAEERIRALMRQSLPLLPDYIPH